MKRVLCFAIFSLLSAPALAQVPAVYSSTIAANSGATVVPEPAGGYARAYALICNYSATSSLFCRSDGGTPANYVGVPIAPWSTSNPNPCHTWDGTQVGGAAITCQCDGLATCPVSGEYIQ